MNKTFRKLGFLHRRGVWSYHMLAVQIFGGELITRFLSAPRGTGALAVAYAAIIAALWLRFVAVQCDPDVCPLEKLNDGSADRPPDP